MVNASAVVAEIRCTVVNVCFAMRAAESRSTVTRLHFYAVDAYCIVLAWIGRTFVDLYLTVHARETSVCAVARVSIDMVNASAVVTGIC